MGSSTDSVLCAANASCSRPNISDIQAMCFVNVASPLANNLSVNPCVESGGADVIECDIRLTWRVEAASSAMRRRARTGSGAGSERRVGCGGVGVVSDQSVWGRRGSSSLGWG